MKRSVLLVFAFIAVLTLQAQDVQKHHIDLGIGFGLDYGGIGFKFGYSPIPYLSVFTGVGYALAGPGYNVGICYNILPKTTKHFYRPNLRAMWGYNAAVVVIGASEYNKVYFGPTFGIGNEFRFGKRKRNGLNFDLNFPIRDKKLKDDIERINDDSRITTELKYPMPFQISIGYHMEF